jgi:DNA invertase Pin-like site-specific DNA recombinase
MKAAMYARVSTSDQTCTLQICELREYIERRKWECAGVYRDSMSGAKASRPGLDQLMADARLHRFDVVLVWKLDRFGRSLVHCVAGIQELQRLGVRFVAVTQNIDTDQANPTSRLLLHVLASVAEFERSLIRERVASGMKLAKARGTRSGRSIGRPRRIFDRGAAVQLRESGQSIQKIADELGVGVGTVVRTLQDHERRTAAFRKATA